MSSFKKKVRSNFRTTVFERDSYRCVTCGFQSSKEKSQEELDAHHITDRNKMTAGGYVSENGITLCHPCHNKAEHFHSTGEPLEGFSPEELYVLIGFNHAMAVKASEKLGK